MQQLKTTVKVTESIRFSAARANKFKNFYFWLVSLEDSK
jgi:hypothetical protein